MKFTNYSVFSSDFKHYGLDFAIEHTVKMGLDSVEHIENSRLDSQSCKLKSVADARNMRRALDENGLGVTCYSLSAELYRDNVDESIEKIFRHIEYAAIIGSPFVHHTLTSGFTKDPVMLTSIEMAQAVADRAEIVAKRCNEYGMVCLYEPQGWYINGVQGVGAVLGEMRARGCNVGVCGDTGNSIFADCMPTEIFSAFKNDIRHIHVKDRIYGAEAEAYNESRGGKKIAMARFGEGNIGVTEALGLIPDYDGALSLEFEDSDDEIIRTVCELKRIFNRQIG